MTDTKIDPVVEERTALAAEHADLSARIAELEAEKAEIRRQLIDLGPGEAGPLVVKITNPRRLNVVRFMTAYPPEEFPSYYEQKPRTAMAKALDDAAIYDLGSTTVTVEVAR